MTFDCYGTLVDWEAGILRAFRRQFPEARRVADQEILREYHRAEQRVEKDDFRPYRRVLWDTAAEVCSRFGWNLRRGDGDFLARSLPGWEPFPDTIPALGRLDAAGFRLGIVSNVDDDLLAGTLRQLPVAFEVLVTAERVRSYKPARPHFQVAVREASGEPDRLLHVAQSWYHDVAPASSVGLRVIWVNRKAEEAPDGPVPTAEVPDLEGAADWLLESFG